MSSSRRGARNSATTPRKESQPQSRISSQAYRFHQTKSNSPNREVTFAEFFEEIQSIYDLIGQLDLRRSIDSNSSKAAAKHLSKRLDDIQTNLQHIVHHRFDDKCPALQVNSISKQILDTASLVPYMLDKQGAYWYCVLSWTQTSSNSEAIWPTGYVALPQHGAQAWQMRVTTQVYLKPLPLWALDLLYNYLVLMMSRNDQFSNKSCTTLRIKFRIWWSRCMEVIPQDSD